MSLFVRLFIFPFLETSKLEELLGTFDEKLNYKNKMLYKDHLHDVYMYLIFSAALLIKKPTTKLE